MVDEMRIVLVFIFLAWFIFSLNPISFFFNPPADGENTKLKVTTLPRIFIHTCRVSI